MESLKTLKLFIDKITSTNSRNEKEDILKEYKDDEDIKYYLNFIYNPYIVTGIDLKSYQRFHSEHCIDMYPDNIFSSTKEALEYLKVHNTGDYNTRELMFSYFMKLHLLDLKNLLNKEKEYNTHELFYNIITKNIQLGINSKIINKIIPNLIPEFNICGE